MLDPSSLCDAAAQNFAQWLEQPDGCMSDMFLNRAKGLCETVADMTGVPVIWVRDLALREAVTIHAA
jgi:hypothetical protein